MDAGALAAVLVNTLDQDKRADAEKTLSEMHKIIGFCPLLLTVVDSSIIEIPVRQAGVIYLKNMVTSYWDEATAQTCAKHASEDGVLPFTIHEQDRHAIREAIIPCLIRAPDALRIQLATCTQHILKCDFPGRWSHVVDVLVTQLQTRDAQAWLGTLVVTYRLVKNYEYKKVEEKAPLAQAMRVILPMLYERLVQLMPDASKESVTLQKLIVKIFFALVQFSLNLTLLSSEQFANWMEGMRKIVERPVPEHTLEVDVEERPDLVWWKCKKWAMHLLHRIFERYGNPGSVASEYNQFADYYLKNFSGPVIATVFHVLVSYRNGTYVSPRVIHEGLMYLSEATSHSFSWKFIKQHVVEVIQEVVYPLMCHSEHDQELWDDDPQEFIRTKYDVFEELINPVHAATTLILNAVKRKNVLSQCLAFLVRILNDASVSPQQKDGAMHMIGALAPQLLKKKAYKNEVENMLVAHVFPLFASPHGFLRARACWCVREFSEAPYNTAQNLTKALECTVNALLHDGELPVQMEAAMAVHMLISDQERAAKLLKPHVRQIIMQLLELIARTENDDICTVMQQFIDEFLDEVIPVAVEAAQRLATIFDQLLTGDSDCETRAITAMGVLGTLESILHVMEEHKEVMIHLEQIVLTIIATVFGRADSAHFDGLDFCEEILSLIESLTCSQISEAMWQVYDLLYTMFTKDDGIDYFVEMMPVFHNYICVDNGAFLSQPRRVETMIAICRQVLMADIDEDIQCHGAKLLEVLVLCCGGRIDAHVRAIVEIVLARLSRKIETSELRTMCLEVLIAILQYNPALCLNTLSALQPPSASVSLVDHFITQWLEDTDCFIGLHDRRMCILGLTTLIRMAEEQRPAALRQKEIVQQLVPSCLLLFEGLRKAIEARAQKDSKGGSDDEDSEDDVDEIEEDPLESDEDEIDEASKEYLEKLANIEKDSGNENDFETSEDEEDFVDETDLETFVTPLDRDDNETDEFVLFKETLQSLEQTQAAWYAALVSHLSADQWDKMKIIYTYADQRKAAAESKKIETAGGYQFSVQQVPSNFNFGMGQL